MKGKILLIVILSCFVVGALMANGHIDSKQVARAEGRQTACIMTAFSAEIEKYKTVMTDQREEIWAGRKFFIGNYGDGWEIVAVIGGVGLSNAASSTQLMFDRYDCDFTFFSGIDGAVDPSIRVGDLVIPEQLVFHDYQNTIEVESRTAPIWVGKKETVQSITQRLTGNAKNWRQLLKANEEVLHGNPKNIKEGMLLINPFDAPSGVLANHYPGDKKVTYFNADGSTTKVIYFPVDGELLNVAREVASEHASDLPVWDPPSGDPYQIKAYVEGTVVSGDQFIMSEFYRRYLAQQFDNVKGLEMEGAAFVQTCLSNQKKCLVTRTASDLSRTVDWWNPVDYKLTKDKAAFDAHVGVKQSEMFAGGVSVPFTADLSAQFNLWMLEEMVD